MYHQSPEEVASVVAVEHQEEVASEEAAIEAAASEVVVEEVGAVAVARRSVASSGSGSCPTCKRGGTRRM